jgi:hypothetical protein
MTTPKTLVTSFIEDYFQWNERSNALMEQIKTPHDADLLSLGITEPVRPDQTTNFEQYLEVKRRYSERNVKLWAQVKADWQKLIEKYCRPNHKAECSSFGSPSNHHPDNEIIVSVETVNKKSAVKTKNTYDYGYGTLVFDYEFHLSYKNERWYLEKIFDVSDEGKCRLL